MTDFEIASIVLSGMAIILSLPALIFSIIKVVNERKIYKKNFIIDNLIKLRNNLNEILTALDKLNPEISMALIFKKIENGENFDYYNEVLSLENEVGVMTHTAIVLLSSYKATEANIKLMKVLKDMAQDADNCMKIVIKNKDKNTIIKKFCDYKMTQSNIKSYNRMKDNVIIELTNTINHFIKDHISKEEIDSYFLQIKLLDG